MRKKNKKVIKINIINMILAFIVIAYTVFNVLSIFVGAFIKSYANFYWLNIRNPIMGFFYSIFEHFPYIGINFHKIGFIIIAILILIISLLIDLDIIKKEKIFNRIINICVTLILIILIPFLTILAQAFSDRNNPRLNEKYFSLYKDKEYTKKDLIKLTEYYRDKILLYMDKFERNDKGEIIFNEDLGLTAVNSLEKSSRKFNYLQGPFLNRFTIFSEREHKNNTDNTLGYSGAFGIKYDPEFNPISVLSVITHELCHTKGLARESETVFCEVIANTEDDIDEVKYSGYLEGFARAIVALYEVDFNEASIIEDGITKYCLTDNYAEICNLYGRNINYYEKGTDHVILVTYTLNLYEDHSKEFFEVLNILVNDFNAKITMKDEELSIEELSNKMNDSVYAKIVIEVDKEKFNKLQPYLIKYSNTFLGINQESADDEIPVERDENESLSYYLAPYGGIDLFKSPVPNVKGGFMDEYNYERVVRLLLEYYSTYGYN